MDANNLRNQRLAQEQDLSIFRDILLEASAEHALDSPSFINHVEILESKGNHHKLKIFKQIDGNRIVAVFIPYDYNKIQEGEQFNSGILAYHIKTKKGEYYQGNKDIKDYFHLNTIIDDICMHPMG